VRTVSSAGPDLLWRSAAGTSVGGVDSRPDAEERGAGPGGASQADPGEACAK